MQNEKYTKAQPSYSEQFRLTHTFNMEILESISMSTLFEGWSKATLGHRDMLSKVQNEIEVMECRISPDFSCSIIYKKKEQ